MQPAIASVRRRLLLRQRYHQHAGVRSNIAAIATSHNFFAANTRKNQLKASRIHQGYLLSFLPKDYSFKSRVYPF